LQIKDLGRAGGISRANSFAPKIIIYILIWCYFIIYHYLGIIWCYLLQNTFISKKKKRPSKDRRFYLVTNGVQ
tara:strand:+ start:200 stop:418 length:219 start_codon:yes stop_codon:yes gene_type:complete